MVRDSISAALAAAVMLIGGGAAMAQQAPVVVPGLPSDLGSAAALAQDALSWSLAEQTGTADAYRTYLRNFPNGANAALARARLGQLTAGTTPVVTHPQETTQGTSAADAARAEVLGTSNQPTPSQPSTSQPAATSAAQEPPLTRDARRQVQARLTQLGYDARGVDGVFGAGTRRAIGAWQSARGYRSTGYLTPTQAQELRSAAPAATPSAPAGAAATEAALGLSATDRRAVQAELTRLGYDTRGADGVFGSGTRRAVTAWQSATGASATGYLTAEQVRTLTRRDGQSPVVVPPAGTAAQTEAALALSRADRIAVQRALTAAGYDTRGMDGIFGSGTRAAIRRWQTAQGLTASGYLTAAQVGTLKGGQPVVAPSGGATAADELHLNLGSVERAEVQTRLTNLGYDPRGIDGRFGAGTRTAIRAWQGDNGLAATGYLNADQLQRLRTQRRG